MKMNERLLLLRKKLHLTQIEFATRITVSRSHLSGLENGTRNFTERVIADICRQFDVNREWLENGTGEIFVDILPDIEEFNNADKDVQEFVRVYMQLDDITKAYYKKKILEELKK